MLSGRAADGVRVRLCMGDPEGQATRQNAAQLHFRYT
jgi:hypothetical protein